MESHTSQGSLQVSLSRTERLFFADAYRHNIKASNLFRESGCIITDKNWLAVLAFGVTVIIFHFTVAQLASPDEHDFLDIFRILRRTARIGWAVSPHFHQSEIKLFIDHRSSLIAASLDEQIWQAVSNLDNVEHLANTSSDVAHVYHHAVETLKNWVKDTEGYPRSWQHFMAWPGHVSDRFVELLTAKHPPALIIFTYWNTIMHLTPKRWFMNGWARRNGCLAMAELDPEWDGLLEWPRSRLK
ncbi:hypothetical protein JX265_002730 [Neoarthrinium moseri]|uniref:Uncharacterized protein n=1 Tax=Neoarthrinium moseri TaxID=1658444 RepID=A0A9Q0AV25_9PEZI|nr:uncharacterized protein JN550_000541 [Neoarthrinium moseri]KAI1842664.1 hypothetical protein JX266_011126 [Neoarthrinium moseri]KAI1878359.1 hypothetical protein JN550_000541 [Neoarthrinium moseri]KAI1879776.1 hypothetical protein JX265_002730 [Neoarthrinium moseri]